MYGVLGRPLEVHAEDRRRERVDVWEAHRRRFASRSLGGRVGNAGAAPNRTHRPAPGEGSEAGEAPKIDPISVETVMVKLIRDDGEGDGDRTARVTVVGDRDSSTLSVVTHHDVCCGFRDGLLPLSLEILTDLARDCALAEGSSDGGDNNESGKPEAARSAGDLGRGAAGAHPSAERVCFYHISAPGHAGPIGIGNGGDVDDGDDDDDRRDYVDGGSGWCMDALAGRMNGIISRLGVAGRVVYLGEGAGANVCLRAAAEAARRLRDGDPRPEFAVAGVALVSPELGGPTVGDALKARAESFLLRGGIGRATAAPLRMLGTPLAPPSDGGASPGAADGSDGRCLAAYAEAYCTPGMRTRLRRGSKRMASLRGVPNLIICSDRSFDGKKKAEEACDVLDATRGSGVVTAPTEGVTGVGGRYATGGGAVLRDRAGRRACADTCGLFFGAL